MNEMLSRKSLARAIAAVTAAGAVLLLAVIVVGDARLSRALWLEHHGVVGLAASGAPASSAWTAPVQFLSDENFWLLRAVLVFHLAAALTLRSRDRERSAWHARVVLSSLLTLLVAALVVTWLLKTGIGRPRPYAGDIPFHHFSLRNTYHSFPSGHTSEVFSYLVPLIYHYRSRIAGVVLVVFGAVIALTRVLLAKHYFADVIVGAYLAAVTALLACKWLEMRHARHRRDEPGRVVRNLPVREP